MDKYNLKQMTKDGYVKDFSETIRAYRQDAQDAIDCKVEKLSNMRKKAERSWYAGLKLEEFNKINKAGDK